MSDFLSQDEMLKQIQKNIQQTEKNLNDINRAIGDNSPTPQYEPEMEKKKTGLTKMNLNIQQSKEQFQQVSVNAVEQVSKTKLQSGQGMGQPTEPKQQPKTFGQKVKSFFKGSSATSKVKTKKKSK